MHVCILYNIVYNVCAMCMFVYYTYNVCACTTCTQLTPVASGSARPASRQEGSARPPNCLPPKKCSTSLPPDFTFQAGFSPISPSTSLPLRRKCSTSLPPRRKCFFTRHHFPPKAGFPPISTNSSLPPGSKCCKKKVVHHFHQI